MDAREIPERDSREIGVNVSCAFGEKYRSGICVWRAYLHMVLNLSDHKRIPESTKCPDRPSTCLTEKEGDGGRMGVHA